MTLVGALELGGSHVSAARVAGGAVVPGSLLRRELAPDGSRDELLATILDAAGAVHAPTITAWGIATPGPFDYERGIVTIRGVGKLEALYGVDLRRALAERLGVAVPSCIRFLNDADAFLLGEWRAGLARGRASAIGTTLGTGLGSAFLRDGRIVESGTGVPSEGRLDLVAFRGAPVEETISTRGLAAALRRAETTTDVALAASEARRGREPARSVFGAFGTALGEFLDPWLAAFAAECLVVGGSISRSWDLIEPSFLASAPAARRLKVCGASLQLDEAPLIGAAHHALTER